jgi:probable selenium-dependent hydroxylase accessory protein YqeC
LAEHPQIEAKGEDTAATTALRLGQAFGIHPGEVISLVGGGGKTTLMLALAKELSATGKVVVTTTTTRILAPPAGETTLIIEPDEDKMLARLLQSLGKHRHITLVAGRLPRGKLRGIRPELVSTIVGLKQVDYVIVEADGAARKPLKAPNATEPVIPRNTSLVLPVVGIEALGAKLIEDHAFRPEIISALTGLPPGGTISADTIAILLTHPRGIIKGSPAAARIIPLVNKIDLARDLLAAEDLASRILERRHPRISRVVLGQVKCPRPVVKVIEAAPGR